MVKCSLKTDRVEALYLFSEVKILHSCRYGPAIKVVSRWLCKGRLIFSCKVLKQSILLEFFHDRLLISLLYDIIVKMIPKDTYYTDMIFFHYIIRTLYVNIIIILYILYNC